MNIAKKGIYQVAAQLVLEAAKLLRGTTCRLSVGNKPHDARCG
jgi:hypothetical protein